MLACLQHDTAASCFIRADHGQRAAQVVEHYVDEESAFTIRYHQVLRFQADESVGCDYSHFDDSPSAHMWRTINWPTRYL